MGLVHVQHLKVQLWTFLASYWTNLILLTQHIQYHTCVPVWGDAAIRFSASCWISASRGPRRVLAKSEHPDSWFPRIISIWSMTRQKHSQVSTAAVKTALPYQLLLLSGDWQSVTISEIWREKACHCFHFFNILFLRVKEETVGQDITGYSREQRQQM